jgi:adenylate cyclase
MTATAAHAETIDGAVVFTDIVGFTEYTALQGDEKALALLSRQEELVRASLPPDARIVKELGDGLLIWFPNGKLALRTMLQVQQRLQQQDADSLEPIWLRCGIHSGRQTRRGSDLVGHDVNVASRIVDMAGPSEVLVSESSYREARGTLPDVSFEELGPVVMKGLLEPVRLYRACIESAP